MPSITVRFQFEPGSTPEQQRTTLDAVAERMRYSTRGTNAAMRGTFVALIDDDSVDTVIDDGAGITTTDRASAAVDDEHEAKARSRAEEV